MKSTKLKKSIRRLTIVVCLLIVISIAYSRYRFGNYKILANDEDHYLNSTDSNITQLIDNWSEYGITVLYEDEAVYDDLNSYYDTMVEYLVKDENGKKNTEKEIIMNFLTGTHIYTQAEIEKALNTLIYGKNSGKETYDSIMEMPVDLYRMCVYQIDFFDGAYVTDIFGVIQSMCSDYRGK